MAVTALIAALVSEDSRQRADAAMKLAQSPEPAVEAAVPLVRACGDEDEQVREWAAGALEELGAPAATDVPALVELLNEQAGDVAYWAATLLGRLGPDAAAAVPPLAAALVHHPQMNARQRAALALGEIGVAAGARPALEHAAASDDPRMARLARQALERL
jgi:HEAT repeat protein